MSFIALRLNMTSIPRELGSGVKDHTLKVTEKIENQIRGTFDNMSHMRL